MNTADSAPKRACYRTNIEQLGQAAILIPRSELIKLMHTCLYAPDTCFQKQGLLVASTKPTHPDQLIGVQDFKFAIAEIDDTRMQEFTKNFGGTVL